MDGLRFQVHPDWSLRDRRRWERRLRWLAKRHPLSAPVQVKWANWRRNFGICEDYGDRYLIRVARRCDYSLAVYVLLEEWAHALTRAATSEAHSDAWGLMYARLIRGSERYERNYRRA